MKVAEAVGRTLALLGVKNAYGVVGSGNFHVTNALIAEGTTFVASRHESGAAMMADAHSRMSGEVTAVTVHQGCGLTNALTGITEAAKSNTPMIVIAADTPPFDVTSNFWINQSMAVRALGVAVDRIHSARTAVEDCVRAVSAARNERRTVVINLPLDVQQQDITWRPEMVPSLVPPSKAVASSGATQQLADLLERAERPLIVGGRGAQGARVELEHLAEISGALLATSAVARGLFTKNPWYLDVMGGFSSPAAAALIEGADLIVAFGASLNHWTTRNGELLSDTLVVQIDDVRENLGRHCPVDLAIVGDTALVASVVTAELTFRGAHNQGYRTADVQQTIATKVPWRTVPFEPIDSAAFIDPRALTIALDDMLPRERQVVLDSGNFCGYPGMFLTLPSANRFCMPLAFQSVGLGLSAAIGAALAQPDLLTVAGMGDGGFMMSLVELDTAVRLQVPMLIVVYNDNAYGAEVHHFDDASQKQKQIVEFPPTDIAAIARGFGCDALTVKAESDVIGVLDWVRGPSTRPLVIDAKISSFPSWVLKHSFTAEALA